MCSGSTIKTLMLDVDEHGEVSLSLPEGVYDLVLHASGYVTVALRGIAVAAHANTTIIRALIIGASNPTIAPPASAIVGRVTNARGEGEAHATVQATSLLSTHMTHTDADGYYFFHGVVPATYTVTMHASDGGVVHERAVLLHPFVLTRADFSSEQPALRLESLLRIEPLGRSVDSSSR